MSLRQIILDQWLLDTVVVVLQDWGAMGESERKEVFLYRNYY